MDIRIDVRRIIGSFAGNYDAYQLSTEPTDIPNNSIQIGKIPVELRCVYGSYVIWNEQVAALKAKSHLPQDVSVAMGHIRASETRRNIYKTLFFELASLVFERTLDPERILITSDWVLYEVPITHGNQQELLLG